MRCKNALGPLQYCLNSLPPHSVPVNSHVSDMCHFNDGLCHYRLWHLLYILLTTVIAILPITITYITSPARPWVAVARARGRGFSSFDEVPRCFCWCICWSFFKYLQSTLLMDASGGTPSMVILLAPSEATSEAVSICRPFRPKSTRDHWSNKNLRITIGHQIREKRSKNFNNILNLNPSLIYRTYLGDKLTLNETLNLIPIGQRFKLLIYYTWKFESRSRNSQTQKTWSYCYPSETWTQRTTCFMSLSIFHRWNDNRLKFTNASVLSLGAVNIKIMGGISPGWDNHWWRSSLLQFYQPSLLWAYPFDRQRCALVLRTNKADLCCKNSLKIKNNNIQFSSCTFSLPIWPKN